MNLLITGLPGVGKGTQSENIVKKYNVKHLSTGNLFRNEIASKSDLGKELASYMNEGKLVPDELTINILKKELNKPDYESGFLLDGFPRTIAQAKALDEMLESNNITLNKVINLDLNEEVIIERLVNRMFCPNCQATFHKIFIKPQVDGICDNCGTELVQREDDKIESVTNRLEIAKEQTLPVVEYYNSKNMVTTIEMDSNDSEEVVFTKITKALDK